MTPRTIQVCLDRISVRTNNHYSLLAAFHGARLETGSGSSTANKKNPAFNDTNDEAFEAAYKAQMAKRKTGG